MGLALPDGPIPDFKRRNPTIVNRTKRQFKNATAKAQRREGRAELLFLKEQEISFFP
jgi:hypothetical protein